MKKKWQFYTWLILFLFLMPFITVKIPGLQHDVSEAAPESGRLVYAANLFDFEVGEEEEGPAPELSGKALIYFTHSHEAFAPITKAKSGKATVSHSKENIMNLGEAFSSHFRMNGISLDVLDYDNAGKMVAGDIHYSKAYKAIRPRVEEQIKAKQYDIVLDVHRDALGRSRTTVESKDGLYAKAYFVIGEEHKGYAANRKLAEKISARMNELVPGISKGILGKSGHGVDGVYNQDLGPNVLLIEMGGTENTEEELNRTIAVVTKAVAEVLAGK
ncbi:stage II sporulation protein P [Bhargavaea ginsengi]|uniref:stage II sporulation protein P n=1 Tax=Bhargavaea ginsengi TaxID=426757 RepID=UPI003C724805